MSTLRLIVVASVCVAVTSCSRESAPPPAAPLLGSSGIDLTTFDKTVRPQDDAFMHVNGGWLAKAEISPDKSSYGAFDILFDKAQADLRAIVEDAPKCADTPQVWTHASAGGVGSDRRPDRRPAILLRLGPAVACEGA